jgi:hypothetical protein
VQHQAVVASGPCGPAGHLLADEAILRGDQVVGERVLVEDVAELAVEGRPLVVADLQEPVFDAEGVVEVLAQLVLRELDRPVGEVAPVEQLDPVARGNVVRDARASGRSAPAPAPRWQEQGSRRVGGQVEDMSARDSDGTGGIIQSPVPESWPRRALPAQRAAGDTRAATRASFTTSTKS